MRKSGYRGNRYTNFPFHSPRSDADKQTQVLIRDRSSAYGTYVNGIRIQHQTLLQDGDIVVRDLVSLQSFFVLISTRRRWDNTYLVHRRLQTLWTPNSAPSRHLSPSLVCEGVGTEDTAIYMIAGSLLVHHPPRFPFRISLPDRCITVCFCI